MLTAPHPDTLAVVQTWLAHQGISPDSVVQRSSWYIVPVTVEQAERMLNATYGVYYHAQSASSVLRTLSYSLPRELDGHVDVMVPTTHFGRPGTMTKTKPDPERRLRRRQVDPSCETDVTLDCLRDMYNCMSFLPPEPELTWRLN